MKIGQEEIDARWAKLNESRALALDGIEAIETGAADNDRMAAALKAILCDDRWSQSELVALAGDEKIRSCLADRLRKYVAKIDEEMEELIGKTLRLYPEEFTELPNGNWVPTERAIEH